MNNVLDIKKKIKEAFGKYEFIENGHYYLCNGKRVGISTTGLIAQYENEFDKDTMSRQVAEKRGISQGEVLEEWWLENLHSTIKGSMVHEYAQSLWEQKEYQFDFSKVPKEIDLERLKSDIEKLIPQAQSFYDDYKDIFTLIGCEIYLGDEEFDECGATDIVFLNNFTNEIIIADFKTNKEIKRESFRHKKMLVPLQDYDDCNYVHYSLQLEDYKFKFEKNTGYKVTETFIIYFNINAENYEIIEPLKMKNEVERILEMRRVKNMNSIPVLLIGASGTGKTRSLKNLPIEETAIINVTNKPLPFKNNGLKVVCSTDYNEIISAIKSTKKKIIVIDDCGYLLTFEGFDKATQKGYDKFTIAAQNFYKLTEAIRFLDNEKIVYIVMHEDLDDDNKIKPKTTGKMLNQQLCIEGLFTVVLRSVYKNGQYLFETKTDGTTVAKSPEEMFEFDDIPNDLAEVDKAIRDYYGFKPIENKEENKESEEK